MPYPSITSYLEAIQLPDSFKDLIGIEPVLNQNNEPILIAGGFAVVFKMRLNGKLMALKCFINESEERTERYAAIADYLKLNPSPYFVTFKYLENELFIDGEEYPVVLMDWVEGKTLGTSMLEAFRAKDASFLQVQAVKLFDLFLFLLHLPIAHGDLKHENILVKENGELVLVDYDGMFIPSLAGKHSIELGSKGYQHPERNGFWFNKDLDNFSMLVLMLTHFYLAELPTNCTIEVSGQLFTDADFKELKASQINQTFVYKKCRHWASFIFDVCDDKSLLEDTNDFFRSVKVKLNRPNENAILKQDDKSILDNKLGEEYLQIGLKYKNGQVVPQDYSKAMEWFLKAAELGNAEAMRNIGLLYNYGRGVVQDYSKTMEWYLKAAEKGNSVSMRQIGYLYSNGNGVPKDSTKAMEWYLKAAEKEDFIAMREIGLLYYYGWGVAVDYTKAFEWYLKSAEKGNAEPMNAIGFMYEKGEGVKQDYSQAMEWYLKSVEKGGNIAFTAMRHIGSMYEKGDGVKQDYSKAMEWYLKAAENGSSLACRYISNLYENGLGVVKDKEKAEEWYKKANSPYLKKQS